MWGRFPERKDIKGQGTSQLRRTLTPSPVHQRLVARCVFSLPGSRGHSDSILPSHSHLAVIATHAHLHCGFRTAILKPHYPLSPLWGLPSGQSLHVALFPHSPRFEVISTSPSGSTKEDEMTGQRKGLERTVVEAGNPTALADPNSWSSRWQTQNPGERPSVSGTEGRPPRPTGAWEKLPKRTVA